jgi:serine/threonine protein kinase
MNYEEMLAAKNDGRLNRTLLPIGEYYRTQVDGKYRAIVKIRPELNNSIVFSGALKKECECNRTLVNRHQLHFTPVVDQNGEIQQLELEPGTFISMEQLLNDNPAAIAENNFIDNTLEALVDVTTYLHGQGIRHICYSPKTVLVRKGDNAVMLLSHGSFYMGLENLQLFYGDDAAYVAPEVLQHGTIDDRCDVFSIGKFMESLLQRADMTPEYRRALKRPPAKCLRTATTLLNPC